MKVSLQKCESYDKNKVLSAIKALLEPLGGIANFVKPNDVVLIKPNMLSCKNPERAATTHPSVVESVVRLCFDAGASKVFLGDSPPAIFGKTEEFWRTTGYLEVAESTGAELLCFEKDEKTNITFKVMGKDVKASVIKSLFTADTVISISKMKTHNLTRITGAIKNNFGFIPGFAKGMYHKIFPKISEFSAFMAEFARVLPVKLNIMDAIEAMDLQGPASGRVRKGCLLLASESPVAVDMGFCKVVGLNPEAVSIMKYCKKIGWGPESMLDVDFVGTPIEDCLIENYSVPMEPPVDLIPDFILDIIKKMVWTGPKLKDGKCIKCGRCKKICPADAIEITNAGALFDRAKCISCFCCMEVCPAEAIEKESSPLMSIILKLKGIRRILRGSKK